MGSLRFPLAVAGVASLGLAACQPAPEYDDWVASYVPHGPLEPTAAVASLQRVTSSSYDEMFPSLSPDGSTLLYVSGRFYLDHTIESPELWGLDPSTSSPARRFAGGHGFAMSPAWMPDGSAYLYATDTAGSWQLVRTRSAQPEAAFDVIVDDDDATPLHPSVSPDGGRVAFSMSDGRGRNVAVVEADGSGLRVLARGDYPAWSPDGGAIAFQGADAAGQTQLFSIDPGGGEARQLTFHEAASIHPAFDPSGARIVFGSTRDRASRKCKVCCGLYLMDADGSQPVLLVGGDVDADWPVWGSDGWVYFTSNEAGDYDVWRVRLADEGEDSARTPAVPSQR
ncbi:MAG: TolB family protein [Myxococcota bacterium]